MWTSGHYVENTGNETLHFLEIFNTGKIASLASFLLQHDIQCHHTDRFQDISLNQVFTFIVYALPNLTPVPQWLALTPPALVKAHLQLSDETIAHLSKTKPVVVGPQ